MFARHSFWQNAGVVFDQMKSQIVLPDVEILTGHERGRPGKSRRLPDGECGLGCDSGRCEVGIPIDAGSPDFKVSTLPRIVLGEDIVGRGVRSMASRDA